MSHGQMPACHADSLHHRGLMRRDTTRQNRGARVSSSRGHNVSRKPCNGCHVANSPDRDQQTGAGLSKQQKEIRFASVIEKQRSVQRPTGRKLQLLNNVTPVFIRAFPFSTGKHVRMMRLGEQRISRHGHKDFLSEGWLTMSLNHSTSSATKMGFSLRKRTVCTKGREESCWLLGDGGSVRAPLFVLQDVLNLASQRNTSMLNQRTIRGSRPRLNACLRGI